MDYFKRLLELLKIEREEDRKSYLLLTETTSVADRRANGLTWYPVAIRGSEMSRGDYLSVEIERTTHHDIAHQMRFGTPASLFSNHDPKTSRIDGIISHQSGNRLRITLNQDELPEWAHQGKLGIDLLFDDNSYDEMQNAVKYAQRVDENGPEKHLINILTGISAPTFEKQPAKQTSSILNPSQLQAVQKMIEANELAVVHGPPGTGKTTTLVQGIKALLAKENKKILVVAPSNTAVDLLSEKLSEEGINVLRVGNPVRVSERLQSLTLERKMVDHSHMKELKSLKKQASEYKNMAHKYKRNFGKAERDQRKALFDEAHRILKEVSNIEQYVIDDIVNKTQVITATLVGANHYTVKNQRYGTVVIDEAGQSLEPACWIPILKANKVVLAGDHFQLPPTIKSKDSLVKQALGTTLLEKTALLHPSAVVLLEEQYRMNEAIMGYSSKVFYGDQLRANQSVANQLLFPTDSPLEFVDTAGCSFTEKSEGTSTINPDEASFLFKHLTRLVHSIELQNDVKNFPSIAIISPYKQQIGILQDLLGHSPDLQKYTHNITINTIDSFQGQERDIVYLSMTRSNDSGDIGFLNDIRRMNVAMTRARKKLVVIGDSATLSGLPFYFDFIAYAESLNSYVSAWELMD